ncbi:MAG: hypothetical protein ACFFDW_03635 [Candidatus Thorarchaeota archaeon]
MTIDSDKQGVLSNFLLEVTQAVSFKELAVAFKVVSSDFQKIIEQDENGKLGLFIERYNSLADEATKILSVETNGHQPSAEEVAIFGEMIILRDFCLNRQCKE